MRITQDMIEAADYIIVGGGTAGCVLANRLSACGRYKVLLIEAGPRRHSAWVGVPAGFQKLLVSDRHNWQLWTTPDQHTDKRIIAIPRGRGLGGSSLINGMIWVRGQPEDFDGWAAEGCTGWAWPDIAPWFERVDGIGARANSTTAQAMVPIAEVQERPLLAQTFLRAAEAAGHPVNTDYNQGQQVGFGYYQVNQAGGRRVSAFHAYLEPALGRKNLAIMTDTNVDRIILREGRAVGVQITRGNERQSVAARHEVILSAGAIHSPHILELSGIGQPERLSKVGITPTVPSPGVGENYADHFCTRMSWRVSGAESLNKSTRGLSLMRAVLKYAIARRGLLTFGTGLAGGFFSAMPGDDRPDTQLFFMHASYGDASRRDLDREPGMTVGVSPMRPRSRGAVHVASSDPRVAPSIQANLLSDPHDVTVLIAAMRETRRIVETASFDGLRKEELAPGRGCTSDADFEAFARGTGQTIYHASGTCRMGTGQDAVTDPWLQVRGMGGLRVVDASIMPTIVSGNTQAAVYAIAEKAAALILDHA